MQRFEQLPYRRYRVPGKPTSCNHPIVDWSDRFQPSLRKQTRRLQTNIIKYHNVINTAKALLGTSDFWFLYVFVVAMTTGPWPWQLQQVQGQHLFHLEEPCSCFSCSAGDHAGLGVRTKSALLGRERILVQNAAPKKNCNKIISGKLYKISDAKPSL